MRIERINTHKIHKTTCEMHSAYKCQLLIDDFSVVIKYKRIC